MEFSEQDSIFQDLVDATPGEFDRVASHRRSAHNFTHICKIDSYQYTRMVRLTRGEVHWV